MNPPNDCKFCALLSRGPLAAQLPHLLLETPHAVVAVNRRPAAPGHVTLIAKPHRARPSEFADDDFHGFGGLVGRVAAVLEAQYQPQRVIFLGDGKPSAHLHFHLIPQPAGAPLDLGAVIADLNLAARPNTLDDAATAEIVQTLRRKLS